MKFESVLVAFHEARACEDALRAKALWEKYFEHRALLHAAYPAIAEDHLQRLIENKYRQWLRFQHPHSSVPPRA